MKVVIMGSGQMLTNLIAGAMDAGCQIVGVFRYEKVRHPLIDRIILDVFNPSHEFTYIKSHKLYEIKAKKANSAEFKKEILKLNPDIILVGTWGEKLKKSIIDLPKFATINAHPSLLPKYRGPNPYIEAIRHMEKESGVTFHLMDENFDTGPILHQKTVKITSDDTGKELREKIVHAAREGIKELLETLDNEIIIPIPQDEKHASYYPQITQDDVMLDFSHSAEEVSAHIRALHPWSRCFFAHKNLFFIPNPYELEIKKITKHENKKAGDIIEKSTKNDSITVLCGDGNSLKMSAVKLYGTKRYLTKFYIKHFID